jgi:hypothetical protein
MVGTELENMILFVRYAPNAIRPGTLEDSSIRKLASNFFPGGQPHISIIKVCLMDSGFVCILSILIRKSYLMGIIHIITMIRTAAFGIYSVLFGRGPFYIDLSFYYEIYSDPGSREHFFFIIKIVVASWYYLNIQANCFMSAKYLLKPFTHSSYFKQANVF